MPPINLAVAIPTLAGSILSLLATSVALVAHVVAPPGRHFRHALILNLLIADGMNSMNNSISGVITMLNYQKAEPLSPGLACTINAFVGQFSVQAVDFNILIMSVMVLLMLRTRRLSTEPARPKILLICVLAWVPSAITSSIGLGLDAYGPVSGNWCWIKPQEASLRYALTHSWRMAIFLATLVIYTYIYIHLKRTFNSFVLSTSDITTHSLAPTLPAGGKANDNPDTTETSDIIVKRTFHVDAGFSSLESTAPAAFANASSGKSTTTATSTGGARHASNSNLRRMLLLNGYPVLYMVLWIPGIATRLVEAVRGASPLWLVVMQASTQYVGLANAITYSWNEKMTERIKRLLR
ncbi:hypothetical protein PG993_014219 [Apiospora rasikravindrae]|uniref:G-protein coupled receptors family 1 profile domain-containing protein n=1 Tax=Apiospora rasikravindrae TaxID=990691 RepID=A0ABR1RSG1_9PEZI